MIGAANERLSARGSSIEHIAEAVCSRVLLLWFLFDNLMIQELCTKSFTQT